MSASKISAEEIREKLSKAQRHIVAGEVVAAFQIIDQMEPARFTASFGESQAKQLIRMVSDSIALLQEAPRRAVRQVEMIPEGSLVWLTETVGAFESGWYSVVESFGRGVLIANSAGDRASAPNASLQVFDLDDEDPADKPACNCCDEGAAFQTPGSILRFSGPVSVSKLIETLSGYPGDWVARVVDQDHIALTADEETKI